MRIGAAASVVAAALAGSACRGPRPTPAPSGDVRPGEIIQGQDERGAPASFKIEAVEPDAQDPDHEIALYALSVRDPASGAWNPYCAPDLEGRARAIPLEGSWSEDGTQSSGAGRVTFACTSGAIGKCVRFGYKPWKTVAGRSLRDFHQACVRMVRADYCGDGRAHTRDGTRVDVWDVLGIQKRETAAPWPEVFEAAWSPGGAAWVNVPRREETVDRLIGECPNNLRGRTSRDARLSIEEVTRRFPQALVFNAREIAQR